MGKIRKRSKKTKRLDFAIFHTIEDRNLKRQWNVIQKAGGMKLGPVDWQ